MTKQILITGTPRSGTTLLAQMVLAHPKIGGSYDSVNFMRMCYERYGEDGSVELLPLLLDTAERIKERWDLELDVDRLEKNLDGVKSYGKIYNEIMRDVFLNGTGRDIWCEKTTNVWQETMKFIKMFPRGKILHIVRNPHDVLASWKKFTHAPGNDYLDIVFNCYSSDRQAKMFDAFISRYKRVDYDELVKNSEKNARSIADFLGVKYNHKMIDTNQYRDKSGEKWSGNSMFGENIKGIKKNNEDKRQALLKTWERDLVNIVFLNEMPFESSLEKIVEELNKSQLASDGMLRYLILNEGVQRFPLDPTDPDNWESEQEQLNKWRDD